MKGITQTMTKSLNIVRLEEKHLEDAAALACARYRALRQHVPLMPARYEKVDTILPKLHKLAGRSSGVAAIRGGRLVGFLGAFLIPEFRGKRSALSPEWGNAAKSEDSKRIYEEMYAHVSDGWVAEGCPTHLMVMLAHDRESLETWHWLGFGLCSTDAVRDLSPVQGASTDVEIRRARVENAETVMAFDLALHRHLAAAPTFLAQDEDHELASVQKWLQDPSSAVWLACEGSKAMALLGQMSANPDACDIIVDEGTTSINSAFTYEDARGQGIASALLNRALAWGREQGYERCAVDFEPMNILAARFWTRHFQPVCYGMMRFVGESAREDG
jgi:GNAT superfamily N-acetyltransferase